MQPFLFGYDFYYLWSVGALLHQGSDPYDVTLLQHQLTAIGWPASEVPQKFTHPINSLWLYWLLATVPFKVALPMWTCLSVGLVLVSTEVFLRTVVPQGRLSPALLIFAATAFPPTLATLIWGQINAVLLSGLAVFALGWTRGKYFRAGLGLSLLLLKPHIVAPFFVTLLVFELCARRFSCLAGCVIGLLMQVGLSLLIAPECFSWYQGDLDGIMTESLALCGATLGQMIECSSNQRVARPLLLISGCIGAMWLTRVRGYSLVTLTRVVVPLSLCVAPYCWMHSFVVLLPSYLYALTNAGTRFSERAVQIAIVVGAALSLPLVTLGGFHGIWISLSWVFLIYCVFCRPQALSTNGAT